MPANERYSPSPRAICRNVGGEAVILDLDAGRYYGLDEVGVRVWELLAEGRAQSEIVDTITAEYEVSTDEAATDINSMLEDLLAANLIDRAGEPVVRET